VVVKFTAPRWWSNLPAWEDVGVSPRSSSTATAPVVIRIPAIAHLAVGFFALGLLALVLCGPAWVAALLLIPVALSAMVMRYRTVADRDIVTARLLLSSRTVRWQDIKGLRFTKTAWAKAELTDGSLLRLPGVTFATLPLLTTASEGRVPNPYNENG
jgi:Bacterial PH domain